MDCRLQVSTNALCINFINHFFSDATPRPAPRRPDDRRRDKGGVEGVPESGTAAPGGEAGVGPTKTTAEEVYTRRRRRRRARKRKRRKQRGGRGGERS